MLHKGLTLQQIAAAVGAMITAANLGDANLEVVPRWAKETIKDDETQNAGRDARTFKVNRWDVRIFNRQTERDTGLPQNCDEKYSVERKNSPVLFVRFLYSYHRNETEEKDARAIGRDDEFFARFERTADYLSVHPFVDAKSKAYHQELQLDKTALVYFRRELCLEASCRLPIKYADFVKET